MQQSRRFCGRQSTAGGASPANSSTGAVPVKKDGRTLPHRERGQGVSRGPLTGRVEMVGPVGRSSPALTTTSVVSTVSAINGKFGDAVRSWNGVAVVNEVL